MRRTYPLCRLSPEAAGQLVKEHARDQKKLQEAERLLAAFTVEVRNVLGTEAVWALQSKARNAIALAELQRELRA